MKLSTLFRVYRLVEDEKRLIIMGRHKGHKGIMVDTDEQAIMWKKRNRQSKRLKPAIVKKILQYEEIS